MSAWSSVAWWRSVIEEFRSWRSDRLARYKQPREVVSARSLPRTALGKVTKHILRDELDLA